MPFDFFLGGLASDKKASAITIKIFHSHILRISHVKNVKKQIDIDASKV